MKVVNLVSITCISPQLKNCVPSRVVEQVMREGMQNSEPRESPEQRGSLTVCTTRCAHSHTCHGKTDVKLLHELPERDRETVTGRGLGWFGGGAWGQGGAPADVGRGGGQEKSENVGVGSPGVRRGEGGHACPHHLHGPGLRH